MPTDLLPMLIMVLAFVAVAAAVFVIGQYVAVQMRVHQRVAAHGRDIDAAPGLSGELRNAGLELLR